MKTLEEFKKEVKNIWGDKYFVSPNAVYCGTHEKIEIICPKHGPFMVEANSFLHRHGCKECRRETVNKDRVLNNEEVIARIKKTWGDRYGVDYVEYKNARTPIIVTCPKHGNFKTRFHDFIDGHGCPRCNESRLEREVENALMEAGINFERQKTFDWTKTSATGSLSFDFFIPELNLAIECQGRQHFMPVKAFGGEKEFEKTLSRDENKANLSKKHGINLVYFLKEDHNRYMVEDRIFFNNVKNLIEYIKR